MLKIHICILFYLFDKKCGRIRMYVTSLMCMCTQTSEREREGERDDRAEGENGKDRANVAGWQGGCPKLCRGKEDTNCGEIVSSTVYQWTFRE